MRIFGQHLLTFVSSINFDLPYAAAASAAALLPLFVSPLCAFSNDKFVSFALSLQHTHRQTHTHRNSLSHSLLWPLCETISATLTCSLALPHTQHVLCSPALFARLLSSFCLSFSLAQRRLRFAIKASRIERFHLSNFCVVVHATLGVFWLFLTTESRKLFK